MLTIDDKVPTYWWTMAPNFGDLIAPWLVRKITRRDVVFARPREPNYTTIGSVISVVHEPSIVWGTGAFGTEPTKQLKEQLSRAQLHAVRGPLTRNKIRLAGLDCPEVYGDPALLVPDFHPKPEGDALFELGIVIRWSDKAWKKLDIPGVRLIDLRTNRIEGTLNAMFQCKRILTSSLHGLIVADAYGIPSAWLASRTPKGLEFKFWDHFAAIDKVRRPYTIDLAQPGWTLERLLDLIDFDERPMRGDLAALRAACPFADAASWPAAA